jgi:hypothetical protein
MVKAAIDGLGCAALHEVIRKHRIERRVKKPIALSRKSSGDRVNAIDIVDQWKRYLSAY